MRAHPPDAGSAQITDVTSARCCVGVWGPKARDLLQSVCENDLSNAAFPPYTSQPITIGYVPALALRISYVGELGWEIYAPMEYGLHLWDTLWEAGRPFGAIAAGSGAFDSLRLEKGYRLWGTDVHSEYNPYEAGLGFAVRLDKGDFLGRSALERFTAQGITRRLCCLTLDDPAIVVMGKEPILDGDRVLGHVTSANYGYTVGQSIAYGYLPADHAVEGTKVELYFFGQRYPATVRRDPLNGSKSWKS
jgi:glycine cleavage system aminomethyltransferase T